MSSALPGQFHGGLVLDGQKSLSNHSPIRKISLPARLFFPLGQRHGGDARPWVRPGDRVLRGSLLAGGEHPLDPPIHASSSGHVTGIGTRPIPHPAASLGTSIVIEPDELDEPAAPLPVLRLDECSPEAMLARIHAAGIVGLGGGAFPTAAKLSTGKTPIDTLILNGAECEPYITADDQLLRARASEVLQGAELLRRLLGAKHTLIAIENDMPLALKATEDARAAGGFEQIRVVQVPARYPAGGEKQLIQMLTGREVPAGALPSAIGVLCQNVATAAAIHRAINLGEVLLSRIVTVTGRGVREPGNLEVRLGTPLAHLIAECGGYTDDAERLILGGPMMGYAVATDQVPVVKAVNAILVAGAGELAGPRESLPCIRCGACAEVCPANLLPQQLFWHASARQLQRTLDHQLFDCIECGCCDVVCPSHIPLVQKFQSTKLEALVQQQERNKADQARWRFEARRARLAEEQRERERAAQQRKAGLVKGATPHIQEALARARLKRASQQSAPKDKTDESPRDAD